MKKITLRLAGVLLAGLFCVPVWAQTILTATVPALALGSYSAQQPNGSGVIVGSINAQGTFRTIVNGANQYLMVVYPAANSGYSTYTVGIDTSRGGTIDVTSQLTNSLPGSPVRGTATPQGLPCSVSQAYTQNVGGVSQVWDPSPNCAVFTNRTTGVVVYAGPATVMGLTHYYEMNDGTGSATLADSIGGTPLNVNGGGGGGAPAWNGTNGLTYNNASSQYAGVPNSFFAEHSTYMFCAKGAGGVMLGDTAGGDFFIGNGGNWNNPEIVAVGAADLALQPWTSSTAACMTVVYDSAGGDQFWIGSSQLTIKNKANTPYSTAGGFGLGGANFGFLGTIYKFGVATGVELPADEIVHNNLVAAAKIAVDTSQSVVAGFTGYQTGNPIGWLIGDSITFGVNNANESYGDYLSTIALPNVQIYNSGVSGQLINNFVPGGIFNQANSLLRSVALPGNPPPQHFVGFYMGINDLDAGISAATLYPLWQSAMIPLIQSNWSTIAFSVTPNVAMTSGGHTQLLAMNTMIANGGYWTGFVDLANDLHESNPSVAYNIFGNFSPYTIDGLHPTPIMAQATAGRFLSKMNDIGLTGNGNIPVSNVSGAAYFDVSHGHKQTFYLTGNVTSLKALNGNQGDTIDLTICQPQTGATTYTVAVPTQGNATGTVTSGGAVTITSGGANWDSNYLPVIYTPGLTCSTYPRLQGTIASGVLTGYTTLNAPAGCSGTGTVQFLQTEPKWNNFSNTAINAAAVGACIRQAFTYDGLGQSIN